MEKLSIEKISFNYKADNKVLKLALNKADRLNVAKTANELLNFMLYRVIDDEFKLNLHPSEFNWQVDEKPIRTAYQLNKERILQMTTMLQQRGLRHDYTFVCNLLIWNFLNEF